MQVLHHAIRPRALVPVRAVENSSAYNAVVTKPKHKLEVGRFSSVLAAGKENETGTIPVSQKSIGRDLSTGGMTRGQNGTNKSALQKNERAGPFLSKVWIFIVSICNLEKKIYVTEIVWTMECNLKISNFIDT